MPGISERTQYRHRTHQKVSSEVRKARLKSSRNAAGHRIPHRRKTLDDIDVSRYAFCLCPSRGTDLPQPTTFRSNPAESSRLSGSSIAMD